MIRSQLEGRRRVNLTQSERRELYALRDDMEDADDRLLLRRAIRHIKKLETLIEKMRKLLLEKEHDQ